MRRGSTANLGIPVLCLPDSRIEDSGEPTNHVEAKLRVLWRAGVVHSHRIAFGTADLRRAHRSLAEENHPALVPFANSSVNPTCD